MSLIPPSRGSRAFSKAWRPQQGSALGPKDYGYWVSQGGSHYRDMGRTRTVQTATNFHSRPLGPNMPDPLGTLRRRKR